MMYILCKTSPSAKKTPLVYEMDRRSICPVCGEQVKTSMFDLAMNNMVHVSGHSVSKKTNFLMAERDRILSDSVRHKSLKTLKGATT